MESVLVLDWRRSDRALHTTAKRTVLILNRIISSHFVLIPLCHSINEFVRMNMIKSHGSPIVQIFIIDISPAPPDLYSGCSSRRRIPLVDRMAAQGPSLHAVLQSFRKPCPSHDFFFLKIYRHVSESDTRPLISSHGNATDVLSLLRL